MIFDIDVRAFICIWGIRAMWEGTKGFPLRKFAVIDNTYERSRSGQAKRILAAGCNQRPAATVFIFSFFIYFFFFCKSWLSMVITCRESKRKKSGEESTFREGLLESDIDMENLLLLILALLFIPFFPKWLVLSLWQYVFQIDHQRY